MLTPLFLFFVSLLISTAVSSRKAPPVPPRGTSKPLISVTAQSSTESAQDTYLDQQDRGSEANSQSGRSNSSDSLCSIRTGGLAQGSRPLPALVPLVTPPPAAASLPPVPAPRDLPPTITVTTATTSTLPQNDNVSLGVTLEQPPTAPRRKLSSIGVQVVYQSFLIIHPGGVCSKPCISLFCSGGLYFASVKRGSTTFNCIAEVSVHWSSSGERKAVSRLVLLCLIYTSLFSI